MFAKFKLRTQMLLGYTAPAAIYLGLALLAAGTANQIFTTFQDVERVQNVILETSNMSLGAEQMVRGLRGYLIARSESFETEYETGFEIASKGAKAVEPFIRSEDQRKRLNRMLELINDYYASSNEMVQLVRQNKQANAIALFNQGKGTQFVQEFVRLNQEFRLAEQAILKEETVSTKGSLTALIWVLLLGSLVLIGLALLTAWFISSGIAQTINQAISAIASSSTEIAAIVEQQERMATQQAASVNETTTTMDELGASSRATSQQIETAVVQAKEALNLAGGGTKAVEQTLEAMSILKTKVEAMQGQIMQLSDQTDQIGNISTLVSDLANQTNMLALNAAVEAVRAGEHGKGFAVVAAEIRKLADQSKRSAEKINLLVADIQRAINSTVMVTDEGTKTVETGVIIAEETAQAFAGVANAINSVVLSSQQISLNAKQQAIAIEQVVDAMNALNQAANQTANGISQTKVGTRNLSEAALDLQAVI